MNRERRFFTNFVGAALKAFALVTSVNLGIILTIKLIEESSNAFQSLRIVSILLVTPGLIVDSATLFVGGIIQLLAPSCPFDIQQAIQLVGPNANQLLSDYVFLLLTAGIHWVIIFIFSDWLFRTGKLKNKIVGGFLVYLTSLAVLLMIYLVFAAFWGHMQPAPICLGS
ncbi:MAG: hypothetical protein WA001_02290 [Patescibacteria group bacterium]